MTNDRQNGGQKIEKHHKNQKLHALTSSAALRLQAHRSSRSGYAAKCEFVPHVSIGLLSIFSEQESRPEHTQVPREELLGGRVNHKPQALKRCCSQDCRFASLPEGNRYRSLPAINRKQHCGDVAFEPSSVGQFKRQSRKNRGTQALQNLSRNPRQSRASIDQQGCFLGPAGGSQIC